MGEERESEATYAEVIPNPMLKERFAMVDNKSYTFNSLIAPMMNTTAVNRRAFIVTSVVLVVMFTLAIAACCIAFVFEISKLRSEIAIAEQPESISIRQDNFTRLLNSSIDRLFEQLLQDYLEDRLDNITKLMNSSIDRLFEKLLQNYLEVDSRIKQLNFSHYQQQSSQIEAIQSILLEQLNIEGIYPSFPASSCAALPPSSPSGYYWVRASNGSAVRVYCDIINLSCGNITGGWMRVAELDMTNSSHQCPSGLMELTNPRRTCVSSISSPGCSPDVVYLVNASYTRVCGKIIGYQIETTNAFASKIDNISSYYVDGVSLTHGSPRQHIWTFAAARDVFAENNLDSKCPCIVNNGESIPPSFVGNDYFCDTARSSNIVPPDFFFSENPLWDGEGCVSPNTCCSLNTPPWFYRELPQPTTDNIEMRVCRDEVARFEDIAIETIELYVQ